MEASCHRASTSCPELLTLKATSSPSHFSRPLDMLASGLNSNCDRRATTAQRTSRVASACPRQFLQQQWWVDCCTLHPEHSMTIPQERLTPAVWKSVTTFQERPAPALPGRATQATITAPATAPHQQNVGGAGQPAGVGACCQHRGCRPLGSCTADTSARPDMLICAMQHIVLPPFLRTAVPKPALYGQHVPQACGEQHVTEGMDDEKASVMSCPPGAQGEGAPAVTEIPPVASQRCIRISCKARRT